MLTKTQDKNVRKWIKALESGKYVQTQHRLRRKDRSMCCLGVACSLVSKHQYIRRLGLFMYGNKAYEVPESIQEEYGFDSGNGFVVFNEIDSLETRKLDSNPHRIRLAEFNDLTFDIEYPDYASVLPVIWEWYEENRYHAEELV